MSKSEYDVFISYRRSDGASLAQVVRHGLERLGYMVFLDVHSLPSGDFDQALAKIIAHTPDFVPLLTPDALSGNREKDDWFIKEVSIALSTERNVCPILSPNLDPAKTQGLPAPLNQLTLRHGITYNHEYCDSVLSRLSELLTKHPKKKHRGIQFFIGIGRWRAKFMLGFALLSLVFICLGISYFGSAIRSNLNAMSEATAGNVGNAQAQHAQAQSDHNVASGGETNRIDFRAVSGDSER